MDCKLGGDGVEARGAGAVLERGGRWTGGRCEGGGVEGVASACVYCVWMLRNPSPAANHRRVAVGRHRVQHTASLRSRPSRLSLVAPPLVPSRSISLIKWPDLCTVSVFVPDCSAAVYTAARLPFVETLLHTKPFAAF